MKTGFIDWTGSELTLYSFEKKGRAYELSAKESVTLDGDPDPSSLARLAKAGIHDIHLSLPIEMLTLREQDFPFDDSSKISDTIAFELEGVLLGSTDDYSIDHIIIESGSSGSRVLAVCMEKARLEEIIGSLSAAGLDPKVITSLDICISGGNTGAILEEAVTDKDVRAEAAAGFISAPPINLRQDEIAYTGDIEKFREKLRSTALLLLVLVMILGLNTSLSMIDENNTNNFLMTEIERAYRSVFPEDRKIIDIERQFAGNIKRLEEKKNALIGLPVLDILRTIAERKDNGITLNEFTADSDKIVIKGIAGSFENVDSLKSALSTVFRGVKVMDSGAGAGSEINFTIMMQDMEA